MRVQEYIVAKREPEIARHMLYIGASFAAGAIAMYFLDSIGGGRRRAFVRDKLVGAAHSAQDLAQDAGKLVTDRVKGVMATGNLDRVSSIQPATDAQLRERVRSRLGHLVSHPRAIEVEVNEGIVRLSGQVLAKELDGLLTQLTGMAGVRKVQNALSTLNDPSGFGQPTGTIAGAGVIPER
jgi:osmotically-inducible protein OsmY